MIQRLDWDGQPVVLNRQRGCLTISVGQPESASVVTCDLEGRLWTAFFDGMAYRRALDGRIAARWRPARGERERRWLSPAEAEALETRTHRLVTGLRAALAPSLAEPVRESLDRAAAFDRARSLADADQYRRVYRWPVGILPPDQYLSLVLQATEGCSFNTCTFCSFYKDRPFHIRSRDEFHDHVRAARAFLGEGLALRRSVFLGDANAIVIPMSRLIPLFEVVHEELDLARTGGIYAFLDGFSGEKKSLADYAALRALGLKRLYIGLESGNSDLLRFLRKPGSAADAIQAVHALHQGGVTAGVIILLGAGGHEYADAHVADTIAVLNALQLCDGDILYFSDLIVTEGMAYSASAASSGLTPLTRSECRAQQSAIQRGLCFPTPRGRPRISPYDIREFVY